MDADLPPCRFKQPRSGVLERSNRIKFAAEIGLARSSRGRHWSRALHRRLRNKETTTTETTVVSEIEMSETIPSSSSSSSSFSVLTVGEDAVEDRVRALQRLVPGGEELGVERLFEETADYIEALEEQVSAMRALMGLLDGFERERKTKSLTRG